MVATQPNNSVEALTDRTVCLHIKDHHMKIVSEKGKGKKVIKNFNITKIMYSIYDTKNHKA